jgi:hypothetical protein
MPSHVALAILGRQAFIPKGTTAAALELELRKFAVREQINALEVQIGQLPQIDLPLKHMFPPGLYVREIFIPAGSCVVGMIHKHEHLNYISRGKVAVLTKDGREILEGPCTMISSAGTKRALYTLEDTVWTTVHLNPSNTRDIDQLVAEITAPTYADLEEFLKLENKS